MARKSAQQARAEGTFRADRHLEPLKVTGGVIERPAGLQGVALECWNQYVEPRLGSGLYEPAEAPLLALWCVVLARLMAVNDEIPFTGLYEADFGTHTEWKKHPGMGVFKQLSEEFRRLSAALGLDPVSRLKLADFARQQNGVDSTIDIPAAYVPAKVVKRGKKES